MAGGAVALVADSMRRESGFCFVCCWKSSVCCGKLSGLLYAMGDSIRLGLELESD